MLRTLIAIIAAVAVLGLAAYGGDGVSVTVKTGTNQSADPPDTGGPPEGIDEEGVKVEKNNGDSKVGIDEGGVKVEK